MGTAGVIGIRETRHIEGLKRVTSDDVAACSVPNDSIAVMATCMDTHNKSDPGGTFYPLTNGPYFGVPYGCLIPKGISNLLVAGRAISADAVAASATRMIPCCMVFGQAAGAGGRNRGKKRRRAGSGRYLQAAGRAEKAGARIWAAEGARRRNPADIRSSLTCLGAGRFTVAGATV